MLILYSYGDNYITVCCSNSSILYEYVYILSSAVDLLEILATHVQYNYAQVNGGSTNTTKTAFHALSSEHY